jgi:RNA polymerase sigma-70 factor (ECF subfamily)
MSSGVARIQPNTEVAAAHKELTREARFELEALPHLDAITRTAARVTGNRAHAEDLAQETFLQAWRSFDRFEAGTNCRAWLFKILFNVIRHDRRQLFNFNLRSFRRQSDDEMPEAELVYEPPVPQHLTDEDVLAALDRVPLPYREVVVLADVEEFAYREIAEMLDIPAGTVMSRLSRGRARLRNELATFAAAYGIAESAES